MRRERSLSIRDPGAENLNVYARSLYALFTQDDPVYEIPFYQRGYSWKSADVSQLIIDILEARSANLDLYFVGAITLKNHGPLEHGGKLYRFYEIIDGQQRITTLILLLKYLHDVLDLSDATSARLKEALGMLRPNSFTEAYPYPVSHSRTSDKEAFENILQGITTQGQHRMYDAFSWFQRNLLPTCEQYAITPLDFTLYLLDNVYMVTIISNNEEYSYQIFETLNNRGESLTALDLMRNRIFRSLYKSNPGKIEDAHSMWDQKLQTLSSFVDKRSTDALMQQIFLYHLDIETGTWIETKGLYNALKKRLSGADPYKLLRTYLSDSSIRACIQLCKKGNIDSLDEAGYAEQLQQARAYKIYHPILFLLLQEKIYHESLQKVSILLSNYIKRLSLSRGRIPVKPLGSAMAAIAARIHSERPKASEVYDLIKSGLIKFDVANANVYDDNAFRQAIIARPNIDEKYAKRAFVDMHNHERESEKEYLDYSTTLHLEHIFPQNPRDLSEWPGFTESHLHTHLRRLGNLTILGEEKNKAASNASYLEKKKIYRTSNYYPTREIPDYWYNWTPQAIEEREKKLLDRLVNIWYLP